MSIEVLTVSSDGQITFPTEMRERLSIKQGDKYGVFVNGDVIILKPIKSRVESNMFWLDEASDWAKNTHLRESQVNDIISKYRKER